MNIEWPVSLQARLLRPCLYWRTCSISSVGRDLFDRRDGSIPTCIYLMYHCVVAGWWSGHVQRELQVLPVWALVAQNSRDATSFQSSGPWKLFFHAGTGNALTPIGTENVPNYRGHATINLSCILHHTSFTACRPAASGHVQRSRRTMTAEPSDSPTTTHHFPQKLQSTARVVNHFLSAFRSVI